MNNMTWTAPTQNTDGSPIAAGEVTGYEVGVWPTADTTAVPVKTAQVGPAVLSFDLTTLGLAPGDYFASVRTVSANDSVWDPALPFTIAAAIPTPQAPGNFSVA